MSIIHEKEHYIDIEDEIEPMRPIARALVWVGMLAACVVFWAVCYAVVLIITRHV